LVRMTADVPSAARFVRGALGRPSVIVVWIDSAHFETALELFSRHEDKRRSFTDCTSFVVIREPAFEKAFTFGRNFEEAGYTRLP